MHARILLRKFPRRAGVGVWHPSSANVMFELDGSDALSGNNVCGFVEESAALDEIGWMTEHKLGMEDEEVVKVKHACFLDVGMDFVHSRIIAYGQLGQEDESATPARRTTHRFVPDKVAVQRDGDVAYLSERLVEVGEDGKGRTRLARKSDGRVETVLGK